MCGLGGDAQFIHLTLQLAAGVDGQLLLGLLQRHLGHAGFDLQAFERVDLRCFGAAGGTADGGRAAACLGLGGFGAGGFLGAGLALGFFAFLFAAQAFLALFEALARLLGLQLLVFQLADFAFGGAVVLHQRDAGRANVGAGAAFDAVEQVVRLELFMLLAEGEKMQLLRQQAGWAGLGAVAAANARQRLRGRWQLVAAGGQQAVAGLDQRHVQGGQGKAHHRPAHQ